MVVQQTGSGKSLCYQLPALLLSGLVLVVSPLTVHIRTSIARLPRAIPAGVCMGGDFKRASQVRCSATRTHGPPRWLHSMTRCVHAGDAGGRCGRPPESALHHA